MFKVYILKSIKYPKTHVGFTDNLTRRLSEHNSGRSFYTNQYKPWELIHTEDFVNETDAVKREKYLKSAAGRKFLKKLLS